MDRTDSPKIRSDGWTAERQLRFLDELAATRSVTRAAASAGMSRESAYRLRGRRDGALFAALWDKAVEPSTPAKSHNPLSGDGDLARLLGNQFRRRSGDFLMIGAPAAETPQPIIGRGLRDFGDAIPPAAATAPSRGRRC